MLLEKRASGKSFFDIINPPRIKTPSNSSLNNNMRASLKSHISDRSIDFWNLIFHSVCIYFQHYLSDGEPLAIHFLVINLDTSSGIVPNKFVIFWYYIFIWCQYNLKSLIICCLFFWWYVNFLSFIFSFSTFFLPNEVIISAIFFPIKSPVASAVF